jgi:hypothetical protein
MTSVTSKKNCEDNLKAIGPLKQSLDIMGTSGVASKNAKAHHDLQEFVSQLQRFYIQMSADISKWKETNFSAADEERRKTTQWATTFCNDWPGQFKPLTMDQSWCVSLALNLKKLADSKKAASSSNATPAMFVVGGIPMAGGQIIPLPSINSQINFNPNAGYVAEMRSLLGGYKSLRHDLNGTIDTYDNGGGITYNTLNNAIASRTNILKAISSIEPPAEYASSHALAIQTLTDAVNMVTNFQNNPVLYRQQLHKFSDINGDRMEQLQAAYGF